MAGYAGFSKSNNAVEAENSGRFPASVLAKKLKVNVEAIKALLYPSEWHHTAKFYNRTDYYDIEDALEIIEELKAFKPVVKGERVVENGKIDYIIWSGSRNHPRANANTYSGNYTIKGQWLIFNGQRKKIDSNGTKAYDSEGKRIYE